MAVDAHATMLIIVSTCLPWGTVPMHAELVVRFLIVMAIVNMVVNYDVGGRCWVISRLYYMTGCGAGIFRNNG